MVEESEYLELRARPTGRPGLFQNWRDLLFLHFSLPASELRSFVPAGLDIDTFPNKAGEERAWVGLVPFRMEGIRPPWLPAVPWLSAFPETNVRTYVHRGGKEPGVWFFSLDAARWLACRYARARFRLPYFHSRMSLQRDGDRISYENMRIEIPPAMLKVEAEVGKVLPTPEPGSLEFFLIERYLLYAERRGKLYSGQVHHAPYPVRSAAIDSVAQTTLEALGIAGRPWEHICFSDGVDVEVFGLNAVA
jgi:uncharacterized protein YqjF (DUF2071 family)